MEVHFSGLFLFMAVKFPLQLENCRPCNFFVLGYVWIKSSRSLNWSFCNSILWWGCPAVNMLFWAFLALMTEPAGWPGGPYGCLMMKTSRAILALKVAASSVVVHCCRKLQVVAETKLTLHVQPWIHIIKTKFMLMLFNQGRVTLQIG